MVASKSPVRTIWPSLNNTFSNTPDTCGRTLTLACGVTVPRASRMTGSRLLSAVATPTVLAGAPRLPPGPLVPLVRAPGSGGESTRVKYQASQPVPARIAKASRLPSKRVRRLRRRPGAGVGAGRGGVWAGGELTWGAIGCPVACPAKSWARHVDFYSEWAESQRKPQPNSW